MPQLLPIAFSLAAVAVSMGWHVAAGAQQAEKPRRVFFVSSAADASLLARVACFREGLAALGWPEGTAVAVQLRQTHGRPEEFAAAVEEINRVKPDLIAASGTPAAQAMHRGAQRTPVVFMMVSDPVASGIVKSLSRPEGNLTGVSNVLPSTTVKLLEVIKEVVPATTRVAFPYDSSNPGKRIELQILQTIAPSLGVSIEPHDLRAPEGIERAFAAMSKSPPGALVVPTDAMMTGAKERIVAFIAQLQRAAIYQTSEYVDAGGLMSYGIDTCRHFRHAASLVDKVLRGAKPGELPVELPTTFEFVINLRTARALGLKLPASVLARADRVIE